ncbi:MAG TPA: hypothetical protein VLG37_05465 [Candidatus Saccharimonadales bacterium]|nr:hypothetical protein [Candidatus Saccharimonadales bacterium]
MPFRSYVETVEAKGWSLYDVTKSVPTETWEERQQHGPVEAVEEGGMYLFSPQVQPGQTLRDAYSITEGLGPCLKIRDANSSEYSGLALAFSTRLAIFTRLLLGKSGVVLFTPKTPHLPISDAVILSAATAEATFARDFYIISPEDFEQEVRYMDSEFRV